MNVLVIGGGGREHALAWKLTRSARVDRVFVAPGNGGTEDDPQEGGGALRVANVAIPVDDFDALIAFAGEREVGMTFVGPEAPLARGIVDAFQKAGLRCFGPTGAAARLEGSKSFAKAFMTRHGIPTARYRVFREYEAALDHLRAVDYEVVIKASGLAAGKGVSVPDTREDAERSLCEIMVERAFGDAGREVVIEERLGGEEATVLAFCDGRTVQPMPVSQDHKRLLDGDAGPNTGGMGAYAPAPVVTPALLDEVVRTVLRPAANGLAAEGMPYVGVLYAGLMIAGGAARLLEFNCRFGDPEAQVVLPLLESDLLGIAEACVEGELDGAEIRWRTGAAATVVAASGGYPRKYGKGFEIAGVREAEALSDVVVFHAGTRREKGRLLTNGGRVLAVTGLGVDLRAALDRAYRGMACIRFEGMQYRRDIGARALAG